VNQSTPGLLMYGIPRSLPISYIRTSYAQGRGKAKGRTPVGGGSSDPMIEAGAPSTQ
jgi:hypothetical protein